MNATHARQLLAFGVLASSAAVITIAGLTAPDTASVRLGAVPASDSTHSTASPSGVATPSHPGRTAVGDLQVPRLWTSAAAAEHAATDLGIVVPTVAAPGSLTALPTSMVDAPTADTGSGGSSSGPDGSSGAGTVAARPTATATEDSGPGRGKGHDKANGHAHVPGSDVTAPGQGNGKGR